jgi:hypothetical protein
MVGNSREFWRCVGERETSIWNKKNMINSVDERWCFFFSFFNDVVISSSRRLCTYDIMAIGLLARARERAERLSNAFERPGKCGGTRAVNLVVSQRPTEIFHCI